MKIAALFPVLLLATALGCGSSATGSAPQADASGTAGAEAPPSELTRAQLGKLDASVRAELSASSDAPIPVRVEFVRLPRADELSEFLLVRYEDVAIGRVPKEMVRVLAVREDVTHIAMLSGGGYDDDSEDFDEL